ncbi:hypothetical protein GCM10025762_16660 [Haloechinothrix salitolerans]
MNEPDMSRRLYSRWNASGLRARWQARRTHAKLRRKWATPEARRRRRYRTTVRLAAVITAPIAVVALITYWDDVRGMAGLTDQSTPTEVTRIPPTTTVATRVPGSVVELHQPFVGTPAASWKDGIDGISVPRPKPVGDFTKKQVARALAQVKRTISASLLDRKVIEDHRLRRYLATLAPGVRRELRDRLDDPAMAARHVTLIHKDYPLLPASPKLSGTLRVRAGKPGELIITAKLAAAYAFDTDHPDRLRRALDIVAVRRSVTTYKVHTGPRWQEAAHGVNLHDIRYLTYSMACAAAQDGYLAPYYSDKRWHGDGPDHPDEYYFDTSESVDIDESCDQ